MSTRERARGAVDREPLHADGAARHALRRRVERTAQGGDEIGAGAPVLADGRAARCTAPAFTSCDCAGDQPVGEHIERQAAGACARSPRRSWCRRICSPVLSSATSSRSGVSALAFGIEAGIEGQRRQRRRSARRSRLPGGSGPISPAATIRAGLSAGDIERAVGDARRCA